MPQKHQKGHKTKKAQISLSFQTVRTGLESISNQPLNQYFTNVIKDHVTELGTEEIERI